MTSPLDAMIDDSAMSSKNLKSSSLKRVMLELYAVQLARLQEQMSEVVKDFGK